MNNWNPGGSFHPTPTGLVLKAEDCPRCGLPTLMGQRVWSREPIRVDAMPVETFEERYGETQRGVLWPTDGTQYGEHVCPVGSWL